MAYSVVPLRYAVDNWTQAMGARSNTDPTLRIKVTAYVNSEILQGQRLQVIHPQYGVVFACLMNTSGRLVANNPSEQLTTTEIEKALRKLGFDITFKQHVTLNAWTREYLEGALASGFTHVRRADVLTRNYNPSHTNLVCKYHRYCVICFNENKNPEYLQQHIRPIDALNGSTMVVSPNDNPNLDFSWLLDFPMHIESILTDNL